MHSVLRGLIPPTIDGTPQSQISDGFVDLGVFGAVTHQQKGEHHLTKKILQAKQ